MRHYFAMWQMYFATLFSCRAIKQQAGRRCLSLILAIFILSVFFQFPIVFEKSSYLAKDGGELILAQQQSFPQPVKAPETIEEAKFFGKKILEGLPEAIKRIWQEEACPLWEETWVKWWHSFIKPWLQGVWQKIQALFGKEVEKRKPLIEEELAKEKEEIGKEIKKEVPTVGKRLWERLKELWE